MVTSFECFSHFQPKEIKEIKDFLHIARRKGAKCKVLFVSLTSEAVKIMKTKDYVKFKVRCSNYLYTLVMKDAEKAEKLRQSLPPGLFSFYVFSYIKVSPPPRSKRSLLVD